MTKEFGVCCWPGWAGFVAVRLQPSARKVTWAQALFFASAPGLKW